MAEPWLCTGMPSSIWFDDCWEDTPYTVALEHARSFCDQCPARVACLKMAMQAEGEDSVDYRAGIYGGMTPQQRHALYKRGVSLTCPDCGQPFDPVKLRSGRFECECQLVQVQPLPDRGDQWTERHTKLARMTIAWLMENDGDVPDALSLSRKMKVGVKDLRRVYQALRDDHVLKRDDTGKLLYKGASDSVERWLPLHLRKALALSQ